MATVELEQQQLLIGGEWVPASSGRSWESSGPVEGVGGTPVAAAGPDDARRAADAAWAAFPAWSATP
ncbi:MAG TPA: NAD-dependent succinate-semialdehyde dehydrogenase, partial [Solirubrobacteraceae bacterium]|nr:NAD-dependent succinate-semialdehyde dehydrogenase [Solirubrobacteraceae bacterium]